MAALLHLRQPKREVERLAYGSVRQSERHTFAPSPTCNAVTISTRVICKKAVVR